jgi:hypothetical protein
MSTNSFINEDGCHKFQKKRKIGDSDDVSLIGKAGYFPDNKKYNKYLDDTGDTIEVCNLVKLGLCYVDEMSEIYICISQCCQFAEQDKVQKYGDNWRHCVLLSTWGHQKHGRFVEGREVSYWHCH